MYLLLGDDLVTHGQLPRSSDEALSADLLIGALHLLVTMTVAELRGTCCLLLIEAAPLDIQCKVSDQCPVVW